MWKDRSHLGGRLYGSNKILDCWLSLKQSTLVLHSYGIREKAATTLELKPSISNSNLPKFNRKCCRYALKSTWTWHWFMIISETPFSIRNTKRTGVSTLFPVSRTKTGSSSWTSDAQTSNRAVAFRWRNFRFDAHFDFWTLLAGEIDLFDSRAAERSLELLGGLGEATLLSLKIDATSFSWTELAPFAMLTLVWNLLMSRSSSNAFSSSEVGVFRCGRNFLKLGYVDRMFGQPWLWWWRSWRFRATCWKFCHLQWSGGWMTGCEGQQALLGGKSRSLPSAWSYFSLILPERVEISWGNSS